MYLRNTVLNHDQVRTEDCIFLRRAEVFYFGLSKLKVRRSLIRLALEAFDKFGCEMFKHIEADCFDNLISKTGFSLATLHVFA